MNIKAKVHANGNLVITVEGGKMDVPILFNKKVSAIRTIDFGAMAPEAIEKAAEYLLNYGLRQSVNDAAASGKTEDDKQALADKRIAALVAGTVGIRGDGAEPIDPVEAEMFRLAKGMVVQKLVARGEKVKGKNATISAEKIAELAHATMEKHGATLRPRAEKIVAEKSISMDIDLDDLGLSDGAGSGSDDNGADGSGSDSEAKEPNF